jgi:DNA (cytosine-5)-methyltransferase 1
LSTKKTNIRTVKKTSNKLREPSPAYNQPAPLPARIRFIDLFCGIGGFRIAFERAGCQCVFSCDWDKFAQETYAANFGEVPVGDIHAVASSEIRNRNP